MSCIYVQSYCRKVFFCLIAWLLRAASHGFYPAYHDSSTKDNQSNSKQ